MWISIVGTVLDVVEKWMKKMIADTGNAEFIAKWDEYFKLGDSLWATLEAKVKTPVAPVVPPTPNDAPKV